MIRVQELRSFATNKYRTRKGKSEDTQALNTRLFYDLIRLNIITEISTFSDIVSNYDLVVHTIAPLSLQRFNIPKEPVMFKFTTI